MASTNTKPASTLTVIVAFATVYLVWGSTYFFIRMAIQGLPPLLMGAMRFFTAGVLMLIWFLIALAALLDNILTGTIVLSVPRAMGTPLFAAAALNASSFCTFSIALLIAGPAARKAAWESIAVPKYQMDGFRSVLSARGRDIAFRGRTQHQRSSKHQRGAERHSTRFPHHVPFAVGACVI